MMLAFGLVAIASYEAMIYLGPVTAAVVLWSRRGQRDPAGRMLSLMAALAFVGASAVVGQLGHSSTGTIRTSCWCARRPSTSGRTCSSSFRWPRWR